jgi:hypothetical protein
LQSWLLTYGSPDIDAIDKAGKAVSAAAATRALAAVGTACHTYQQVVRDARLHPDPPDVSFALGYKRALDDFQQAADACVIAIDHRDLSLLSGYGSNTDLGNSAFQAAMQTLGESVTGTTATTATPAPTTTTTEPYTPDDWMREHREALRGFGDIFSAMAIGLTEPAILESNCNLFVKYYDLVANSPTIPNARMATAFQKMISIAKPIYTSCKANPRVLPRGVPDAWGRYVDAYGEFTAAYTAT